MGCHKRERDSPPHHAEGVSSTRRGEGLGVGGTITTNVGAPPLPNPPPQGGRELQRGVLDDVPPALPALTRAVKLQDKAAKVGFDWPSLAPVFDKLKEEIAEFEEVALPSDPRGKKEGPHKPV